MSPPPTLIFDFGNVVAHFDYRRAGDRLGRSLGIAGEALMERARAAGFGSLLRTYESGGMTSEDFHREFSRLTGGSTSFGEFREGWTDIFWANESVHHLITDLHRAGHRLILGSNTNALHATHFRAQFADLLGLFDAVVLSHEVGCCKPDGAFYLACAQAAGRPPGECLFIDDLAENVEGARQAGLLAVQYLDTPRLIADLRPFGLDVN